MSEILKTEAIVLRKLNYGDTSTIASLFTKDYGKLSVMVKGGRNPKSKSANLIDPLNHIHIVIYRKDTREVQLLSSADMISHYPKIKQDLEKLKYSYAVLELINELIPEFEVNLRLFKGIIRILELFETSTEEERVLFGRFFIFFISLLGYEIQFDKCSSCGKAIREEVDLSYDLQLGILCNSCSKLFNGFPLTTELFRYLKSLKLSTKAVSGQKVQEAAITFMEKYLRAHIPDFQELQSIKIFK
jgi:DNA repair protein RecO (recombination protein O)